MFQTKEANALRLRYRDAYRIQNTMVTIAVVVKVLGAVGGGWLLLVSMVIANSSVGRGALDYVQLGMSGVLSAAGLGLIALGFIWGTLIACQAQLSMAALDSAVCASPFLTAKEAAIIMGIDRSLTDPLASVHPWPVPPVQLAQAQSDSVAAQGTMASADQSSGPDLPVQGWRCICGHTNLKEATECPECKRAREATY